jgi:misacylated tRNA(Ala) deacylase
MTDQIFRTDAYAKSCDVTVIGQGTAGGIILDRTIFYAAAGGQPGDTGTLTIGDQTFAIAATVYDPDKRIVHVVEPGATLPAVGATGTLALDWERRHRLMRMHSGLHLLCSLVKFPVTGGQIGDVEGRLDFDIEDASAIDKDKLTAELQALIAANHPITTRLIPDAELEANPHLVRTMSVKPPMGTGHVRLVLIGPDGAIDMQPCGGTHVASTAEIGLIAVTKIEKKGRLNRRIRVAFV